MIGSGTGPDFFPDPKTGYGFVFDFLSEPNLGSELYFFGVGDVG